jgi:hypothetical protein
MEPEGSLKPLAPVVSHMDTVHIVKKKIHFNKTIASAPCIPSGHFSSVFNAKMYLSALVFVLHAHFIISFQTCFDTAFLLLSTGLILHV